MRVSGDRYCHVMHIYGVGGRARLVARVGWVAAGVVAPDMDPGDRAQIAIRAREAVVMVLGRPARGPAEMARALGIGVFSVFLVDCDGEASDANVILYRWVPSRAERRARIAHGLAHALLLRERWAHSETDALLLGLEFL